MALCLNNYKKPTLRKLRSSQSLSASGPNVAVIVSVPEDIGPNLKGPTAVVSVGTVSMGQGRVAFAVGSGAMVGPNIGV